jgi:hypothetical protein
MKTRIQYLMAIGLLILVFWFAWYIFPTQDREPVQTFPATVNRDCAPWDGAAFTISIPYDSLSTIQVSIWQSPDIKVPASFSFPDETGRIGNASLITQLGSAEQLAGAVFIRSVEEGIPVEGEFNLVTQAGRQFKGKFMASWGDLVVMCG